MKALLAAVILALLAMVPAGAAVPVQTGEHAAFTRVVLTLPQGATWKIGRSELGYDIQIVPGPGFDLRRFFDLIPRTRIAAVTQSDDGTTLSLRVTCLCRVEAYVHQRRFLVVDIVDGPPEADSLFERTLVTEPATVDAGPVIPPYSVSRNRVIPLFPTDEKPLSASEPEAAETAVRMPLSSNTGDVRPGPEEPAPTVERVGADIAQSVARALSTGVISSKADVSATAPIASGFSEIRDLPGVTMRTSRDVPSPDGDAAAEAGLSCLHDRYFAVEDWADDRPFNLQARDLSIRAFPEGELPDFQDVLALSRLYLSFGFAEEAQQMIATDGRQSVEGNALLTLSQILLGGDLTEEGFSGQAACPGRVAFWAFLQNVDGERPVSGLDDPDILERLIGEFRQMPQGVKTLTGPRLVDAFLASGHVDAAMQIMGRIPAEGADTVDMITVASDLALAHDDKENAARILQSALADGRGVSAPVMSRVLSRGADTQEGVDDETLVLADAVLFEARGSESAAALALAQFRYHLSAGAFDAAAQMILSSTVPEISATDRELRHEFAQAAIANMPDLAFGRYGWDVALLPEDQPTLTRIANRLDTLGFRARAAELRRSPRDMRQALAAQRDTGEPANTPDAATTAENGETDEAPTALESAEIRKTRLEELRALVSNSQQTRERASAALEDLTVPGAE